MTKFSTQLFLFYFLFLSNFLFSQCYYTLSNNNEGLLKMSSGNNLIDNTVITSYFELKKFFGSEIELFFSENEGPYFEANPQGNSKIVFSGSFGRKLLSLTYGVDRIKAVMAHEFAHAMQFQNRISWIEQKYAELHADFLAGFYIGKNGLIKKEKLKSFAEEFFTRGDFNFFDPDHHGTPEERRCAFLEGYKVSIDYGFNIYQAFNCGVEYVRRLSICNPFKIINEYSKDKVNVTQLKVQTGSYRISSTQNHLIILNMYGAPIGDVSPGKDLLLENLSVGRYLIQPCKIKKSGKLKRIDPLYFEIKPNHTNGFTFNKIGLFRPKSYTIYF